MCALGPKRPGAIFLFGLKRHGYDSSMAAIARRNDDVVHSFCQKIYKNE